jgi:glycosyltransferase involved in cell wall biosynthesis
MSNNEIDKPVLVWVQDNPMTTGGFQTVSRNLLPHMTSKWDVHVLSYVETQFFQRFPYRWDGYGIHEVCTPCGFRSVIAELNPDVIVCYGAYIHLQKYTELMDRTNFPQAAYLVIEGPPIPKSEKERMSKFDMIMTPSMYGAELMVDSGFDAHILHHGVNHEIFYPGQKKVEGDKFIYGSVKVNNFKGQLGRLVSAYSKFCNGTNTRLLIHTNPLDRRGFPLTEMVDDMGISDYVSFSKKGSCQLPMTDVEMAQMYRSFDVYVSTSGADSCNLPALEASACGVPSILVDVPGPSEYVGDSARYIPAVDEYPSGFGNVKLANVKILSDTMKEYYDNPELRLEMSKKAFESSKQWSWERSAEELEFNLRKLI